MADSVLTRYLRDVAQVGNTGGGTDETSYYEALGALLNAVGSGLKPGVKAVFQLKDIGFGRPDVGFFTSHQFDREGDLKATDPRPDRGAGEVKGTAADLDALIRSPQVRKYLDGYGAVLVTNLRAFASVVAGPDGGPVEADRFEIASSEAEFWDLARDPKRAGDGADLETFLEQALQVTVPVHRPEALARTLAGFARRARHRLDALAETPGGLHMLDGLREALETTLGASFDSSKGERFFRATVVQTLFYGVFSAWTLWHREEVENAERGGKDEHGNHAGPTDFRWQGSAHHLRVPVIAQLFHELIGPGRNDLGIRDLLNRTERLLHRVDRRRFFALFSESEAVQYFYEPFLEAYDPVLRKQLGVWYTPPELVRYMVTRVDAVLRDELGVAEGLASDDVLVLDPCCGTGAFLVEVLRRIRRTLESDPDEANRAGTRLREAATKRLFGFEILTAPFVVAHLQLGLALREAGAPLRDKQRAAVYLTNALTGWNPQRDETAPDLDRLPEEFEQEVESARAVKREKKILVVLGNPPYDGYAGVGMAKGGADTSVYRTTSAGVPKPSGQGLNDLYVQFFRVAERQIAEQTGRGVVCYVSNNKWLDGSSHPGMRERFLTAFDQIWIDNLHGDSRRTGKLTPDGKPDPSAFSTKKNPAGIQVGTAVALLLRSDDHESETHGEVEYRDFWGSSKLATLDALSEEGRLSGLGVSGPTYQPHDPRPLLGLPLLRGLTADAYLEWPSVADLFPYSETGIKTARDEVLVEIERAALEARMARYFDPEISDAALAVSDPVFFESSRAYDPIQTRAGLQRKGMEIGKLMPYLYRPFDMRWLYWVGETKLLDEKRADYVPLLIPENEWLVIAKRHRRAYDPPLVSKVAASYHVNERATFAVPLYLNPDLGSDALRENLSKAAREYLATLADGANAPAAEDLFYHTLAVLHAPAYAEENGYALKLVWPRVPLPATADALRRSAALGRRVAAILDPDAPVPGVTQKPLRPEIAAVARPERADRQPLDLEDPAQATVDVGWGHPSNSGKTSPGKGETTVRPAPAAQPAALGVDALDVHLNEHVRWTGVPRAVWETTLGGYPVLKKWLSYRDVKVLGRPLTPAEVDHFRDTARRLAALLLLGPDLDAAYSNASA